MKDGIESEKSQEVGPPVLLPAQSNAANCGLMFQFALGSPQAFFHRAGSAALPLQPGDLIGLPGFLQGVVVQRQILAKTSGVSLTSATSHQLAVNAAGGVQFAADDVQTAPVGSLPLQANIRSSPGHVGRHGNLSGPAGFGDDRAFQLRIECIQDDMGKSVGCQLPGQFVRRLNGPCSDQHRAAHSGQLADFHQ